MVEELHKIGLAIIDGQESEVKKLVTIVLNKGIKAEQVVEEAIKPAMVTVGDQMTTGEKFIPEVLLSGRAATNAMEILRPRLSESAGEARGKIVLGTVEGDLHNLGKNFVGMMLEASGFEVIDLGTDVAVSKFVEAVETLQPNMLGMSALLTTTMQQMSSVIHALEEAGLRNGVKVIIGGAVASKKYAEQIGADAYGADASEAISLAMKFI